MTHLRLSPPIPLDTPHGPGYAHILIDRGQEHHLEWVVFVDASGECRTVQNPLIRLQKNETMGIRASGLTPMANIECHTFEPIQDALPAFSLSCKHCGKRPSEHPLNPQALDDLYAACKEFVERVERGEARSTYTYNLMKKAVAKAESVQPIGEK